MKQNLLGGLCCLLSCCALLAQEPENATPPEFYETKLPEQMPSGIYFVRLQHGNLGKVAKLMLK